MQLVIVIQLVFVLSAMGVIVTGLRAIRADIQRLINAVEDSRGR